MKKYTFLFFLVFTTISLFCQITGHVSDESLGVAFDVPPNWFGQELEDIFVMTSYEEAGLIAMMFHPASNTTALIEKMQQGLTDATINLMPVGELEAKGSNRVEGMYAGLLEGQNVKGKAVALVNPHGEGIVVLSLVDQSMHSSRTNELADWIANSISFSKPAQNNTNYTSNDPSFNARTVQQDLVNTKLVYRESYYSNTPGGGGYERSRTINLCPNGQFTFYNSSYLNLGDDPNYDPYTKSGNNSGTYQFINDTGGVYLELKFSDGDFYRMQVSYEGSKT
ncbi:MAG: hypothetical protein AAGJ93_16765, partial [Bacteroidota bacterium]